MLERIITPIRNIPFLTRALDCLLLGFFIINPISMLIFDEAHKLMTEEQLKLMHESVYIRLVDSLRPEFLIFSISITLVTILVGISLKYKDQKKERLLKELFQTRLRINTQTLNSVNHPIFQIDLDLNYKALNTYYLNLLGYKDTSQIIGKNYREFYDEASVTEFGTQVNNVANSGYPVEYILDSSIAETGKVRRILNPVKDISGNIKGIVVESTEVIKKEARDIVSICSYCKAIKIDDNFVRVEKILPYGLGYEPKFFS